MRRQISDALNGDASANRGRDYCQLLSWCRAEIQEAAEDLGDELEYGTDDRVSEKDIMATLMANYQDIDADDFHVLFIS